ncbi:MAG: DNA mismatch repair endonuclease MutL [Verrucomicrobiales bacterium]
MNRIHLLSEQVANQIAAGEVVERPASVVKELVENALDAEATSITVEIQAGGRSLIRVTDDGWGMTRDDALLSLERHATSKIQLAEDLSSISTMGFRGEAIPSIASVSRMTITTRNRECADGEGTQIVINGGKILEVKAAGCAIGSSIEVRQIFFNLPARRKFLRSEQTEQTHIQHYLLLVGLSHPNVALAFIQDGRVVWQLPPVARGEAPAAKLAALRERFAGLYSRDIPLLDLVWEAELPAAYDQEREEGINPAKVRVWGAIGAPGVSRSNREDQHLFVNRRPVDNKGLNFALMEGYHNSLMKGRYPLCCLFIELDPGEVDVNIHPSKREVKFHRESAVRQIVTQAVRETLLKFHTGGKTAEPLIDVPRSDFQLEPEAAPAPQPVQADLGINKLVFSQRAAPAAPDATPEKPLVNFVPPPPQNPIANWPEHTADHLPNATAPPSPLPSTPTSGSAATIERPSEPPREPPRIEPAPLKAIPLLEVPLRMLGVIGKLYVILESDRGLVLLDQHAAHERVLYEQMLRRMESGTVPSQRLLLPETIELGVRDAQFVQNNLEQLTRLGVGLSEFGERCYLLDALPPFIKASDPRRFVFELIDGLKSAGAQVNSWRLGEDMIAKTVCRHAVKANDVLSMPELENLLHDLRQCVMPYTCPHGRPTLIEMNFRELEKKFGRIQ